MAIVETNEILASSYTLADNTFTAKEKSFAAVEVGDAKQPDNFYPQVKIMRWDNEVNFSARLVHEEATPQVALINDKVQRRNHKLGNICTIRSRPGRCWISHRWTDPLSTFGVFTFSMRVKANTAGLNAFLSAAVAARNNWQTKQQTCIDKAAIVLAAINTADPKAGG